MSFIKPRTTQDALAVFGLTAEASMDEIKKAYHKLALKFHPDVNPDAKEVFLSIQYAYEFLTNPDFKHQETYQQSVPHVTIRQTITFEEGFFGTNFICTFSFAEPEVLEEEKFLYNIEPVVVVVPPGTARMEMVYPGKGIEKNGIRSSVIIHIEQETHPFFRMQGKDINITKALPLDTLLCGGKIEVETMYGLRKLKVKPGTPPGSKLLIPNVGVSKTGHQYVEVQLVFPEEEELRSKKEWQGLSFDWE